MTRQTSQNIVIVDSTSRAHMSRLQRMIASGAIWIVAALVYTPDRAWTAGLEFPDSGSLATTRGGASVSGITDPTAGFLNPGVLSRLSGLRISYNHNLIFSNVSFDRAPSAIADQYDYATDTNISPGEGRGPGSNQNALFPLNGLLAISYQLQPNLTLGLSAHGPNSGGGVRYPVQGGQRYMITSLDAFLAFIGASVAYGGDNWGIGTTLQLATLPEMNYRLVIDGTVSDTLNPYLSALDVEAELSVSDPAAFTALIGAWYRPTPSFEIALSGRVLPVTFNAEGDVNVYNTPNQTVFGQDQLRVNDGAAALDLTLPQTARLGFRYRGLDPSDRAERFDIELALVYERWSVMDQIDVQLQGGVAALGGSELNDVTIDKRWRDTLSVRLGGSYRVLTGLKLSAGSFYEQGATPRQYANIDFPSYDRFGVAGGIAYEVISGLELVVGYLHIFEVDFTVNEREAKVFQQRPLNPCNSGDGCGTNASGEAYSGVPANAGRHRASFQNITLGVNAAF